MIQINIVHFGYMIKKKWIDLLKVLIGTLKTLNIL